MDKQQKMIMKRNLSEKLELSLKQKNKKGGCFECQKFNFNDNNNKRFLITVSILGSAGPLRFLVNEEDQVGSVIETTLKLYSKEGRLPLLGSSSDKFLLYCVNSGFDALSSWDEIGSSGVRNFVLCKKPELQQNMTEARSEIISRKESPSWKSWLNRSLTLKTLSH